MFDALNVSVSGDLRESGDTSNGNEGVLKPVKSNVALDGGSAFLLGDDKVVLGKVADEKYNVLYLFVYSTDSSALGVYAYDPTNYFDGHAPEEVFKIYTTSLFNFSAGAFVKADITYTQHSYTVGTKKYEDTPFLFFTDNENEPFKLNVLRAVGDSSVAIYTSGSAAEKDFIYACPKAPVTPVTFEFVADTTIATNEFRNINGFQFAYQAVFRDGNLSAISTHSDVAVPPSYINQGPNSTANLLQHNACILRIPSDNLSVEVEKVKILVKRGEIGKWFELTEELYSGAEISYQFNNSSTNIAVSSDDQTKQYDNLPRRAKSQTITGERLIYANYLEGFTEIDTEATIIPKPQVRQQDFINYNIDIKPSTCLSERHTFDPNLISLLSLNPNILDKNTAITIDTANLPAVSAINDGDIINLSFSISPKNNWHIYSSEDSYHQSAQLGDYWGNLSQTNSNTGFNYNRFWQNNEQSGSTNVATVLGAGGTGFYPAICDNGGVGAANASWTHSNGEINNVRYGTSAGNPLIVHGMALPVKIKIRALISGLNREQVSEFIASKLAGEGNPDTNVVGNDAFEVIEIDTSPTYTFDLGLMDGDSFNQTSPLAKLITMTGVNAGNETPIAGNFILNKATVEFGFFKDNAYISPPSDDTAQSATGEGYSTGPAGEIWRDDRRLGIYIKSISNVEVLTCARRAITNSPWVVMGYNSVLMASPSDLDEGPLGSLAFTDDNFWASDGAMYSHLGRLMFSETVSSPFYDGTGGTGSRHTLMDGAGGMSGGPRNNLNSSEYDTFNVILNVNDAIQGAGNLGSSPMRGGLINVESQGMLSNNVRGLMPLWNTVFVGGFSLATPVDNDGNILPESPDHLLRQSAAQIFGVSSYVDLASDDGGRTFKSSANHSFGVVYYDHRGRSSNVHSIGTAFSPPFHAREDGLWGKVHMAITMTHAAPSYATHYQIVYTGNTSMSGFTQYTTGGAFIIKNPDLTEEEEDGNIYVSLNYLQENNNVSYTQAFGARDSSGFTNMYSFKEGDMLRVISYYTDEDNRIFVNEPIEFEVAGYRSLVSGSTNPLFDINVDENTVHPAKEGAFIVLKNNPAAEGFSFEDVLSGGNNVNSAANLWNNRCVVEIYSPKDSQDEESQLFYETSDVFPIVRHPDEFIMMKGDTWWRRLPVNMPKMENGVFKSIVMTEGSQPKFVPYYLESEAFNDTVRHADVSGKGKVKIIAPDIQETVRSASLTFSDKNNPASSLLRLTSFNPSKLQYKDLSAKYGGVNYLVDQNDSIYVIQENKCSAVPMNRNIITDVSNNGQLIASASILGTERYFAGDYGCDNNPESVCVIGGNIYFANKQKKEVYLLSNSRISVISNTGMKSFFRKLFTDVIAAEPSSGLVKVVGGYDPLKDEFIISVYNQPLAQGATVGVSGEGDSESLASLTTQLHNVLEGFLSSTDDAGNDVFSISQFPQPLQDFYSSGSLDGFDTNQDGMFNASEVVAESDIAPPVQNALNVLIDSLPPPVIQTLSELIIDQGLTTAEVIAELQNTFNDPNNPDVSTYEVLLALITAQIPSEGTLQSVLGTQGISTINIVDILSGLNAEGVEVAPIGFDFNADGHVGTADLVQFLLYFGSSYTATTTPTLITIP